MIAYKMISKREKEEAAKKPPLPAVVVNNAYPQKMTQKEFTEYVNDCESKGWKAGAKVFKKTSIDKITTIAGLERNINNIYGRSIPPYFIYLDGGGAKFGVSELVLVPENDL